MIREFSTWLASTSASNYIGGHPWITPMVQTIHILAIAALSGALLMVTARLAGVAAGLQPILRVESRFGPWFWSALAVLLATGVALTIGEPDRELQNLLFRIKMAAVIALALLFATFRRRLRASPVAWDGLPGVVLALAFGCLWLLIVSAGRWIAYV